MQDAIRERAEFMAWGDGGQPRPDPSGKSASGSQPPAADQAASAIPEGVDWAWWSFDAAGQTPRELDPGQECFANYVTEDYTTFDWFLNLGIRFGHTEQACGACRRHRLTSRVASSPGFVPIDALPEASGTAASEL